MISALFSQDIDMNFSTLVNHILEFDYFSEMLKSSSHYNSPKSLSRVQHMPDAHVYQPFKVDQLYFTNSLISADSLCAN